MKKIILFLVMSALNFSCVFLNDPDFFMRKAFEAAKEVELDKSLYCDQEGKYMIYYYEDSDYLQIGLMDKLRKNEEYFDVMERMSENSAIIYDIFLQKIVNSSQAENFSGIEFRHYLNIEGEAFMLNKLVVDVDGDVRMLFNSGLREVFENSNDIYYTDDITY